MVHILYKYQLYSFIPNFFMNREYDVYICPPDDAEWQDEACKCHKMSTTDAYIMNAKFILEV